MNIPLFEKQLIIAHILGVSREYVLAHPEICLKKAQKLRLERLLERRRKNEPLAYILEKKEFYGLSFKVTRDTLIPRPETELLVEKALLLIDKKSGDDTAVIDIGTGSGNIIVSIAKSLRDAKKRMSDINCYATDISSKALRIARHNAKIHGVYKNIKFVKSDLLEEFARNIGHQIRNVILIANLPYLSEKIYNSTPPDVKEFEPKKALLSGQDGLDHYKKLFGQIKNIKKHYPAIDVLCLIEFSPEQKPSLEKLIEKHFPQAETEFKKDLAGKWRMVYINLI